MSIMNISAVSTPNFKGKRDNIDTLINLDDNAIRQVAYAQTASRFDNKKQRRISNALIAAAPVAAGLGAAVLSKGQTKLFSKELTGTAARAADGLVTGTGWAAGLGVVGLVGLAKGLLSRYSGDVRKFDNEHPVLSMLGTLAAAAGSLVLFNKGVEKLAARKAPEFLKKGTETVAKFLNENKNMISLKNSVKNLAEKTPSALKEFGKKVLDWAPSLLIFGGVFHSISSANAENRDFARNYTNLKNEQSKLAKARVLELSMENDFLKTEPKNAEDLELLKNPTAGLDETIDD